MAAPLDPKDARHRPLPSGSDSQDESDDDEDKGGGAPAHIDNPLESFGKAVTALVRDGADEDSDEEIGKS